MFVIVDHKMCLRVFGPFDTVDNAIQSIIDDVVNGLPQDDYAAERAVLVKKQVVVEKVSTVQR